MQSSELRVGVGLPEFAPDLDWPEKKVQGNNGFITTSPIDCRGALTPVLSLSGKFELLGLRLFQLVAEPTTVKLTVNGVVIWNVTYTTGTLNVLLGGNTFNGGDTGGGSGKFIKQSLLLEVESVTAEFVTLDYVARPIK